eukprot:3205542-Amphidinium_carterae.1
MSARIIVSFLTAWMYRSRSVLGIMDTCPVGVPPSRTQIPLRECLHMTTDHLLPGSLISLGDTSDLVYRLPSGFRYIELPVILPQATEDSHHHWRSDSEWNRFFGFGGFLAPGYRGSNHVPCVDVISTWSSEQKRTSSILLGIGSKRPGYRCASSLTAWQLSLDDWHANCPGYRTMCSSNVCLEFRPCFQSFLPFLCVHGALAALDQQACS